MFMFCRICFSSKESCSPSVNSPSFEFFAQIIVLMRAVICGVLNDLCFLNSSNRACEI